MREMIAPVCCCINFWPDKSKTRLHIKEVPHISGGTKIRTVTRVGLTTIGNRDENLNAGTFIKIQAQSLTTSWQAGCNKLTNKKLADKKNIINSQ